MRLSFRTQIVGSTVLIAAGVMVALGIGTEAVLELTAQHDIDRALQLRVEAATTVLEPATDVSRAEVEPGTKVYDAGGRPVVGSIEHGVREQADRLAARVLATGRARTAAASGNFHLEAAPYTTDHGDRGVIVVATDGAPYERSERYALMATIVLGAVVVVLAGAAAVAVTRRALRPVQQMAERAAEWSEHDLTHRFGLGPPGNELAALGETLDHLLDRVATAIRSEQRLTSELAHELRTPLTAVRASADLALLRPDGDPALREDLLEIRTAAQRMAETVTSLLGLAHSPEATRGAARTDLLDVLATVSPLVPERLAFDTEIPEVCPLVAAPEHLVVRALAPIVENAVQHAESSITIQVRPALDRIEVAVCDDGPGVPEEIRRRLFDPGTSGSGGTGLGLGIARRVARSLGGDVSLAEGPPTTFLLRFPPA